MVLPVITPYAALLALIYIGLGVNTVRQRIRHQVTIGTKGHEPLERAARAHANFGEYVPFALLLLLLLEYAEVARTWIAVLAGILVVARLCHTYSLLVVEPKTGSIQYRKIGIGGTLAVLGISAAWLLLTWLQLSFANTSV